MHSVRRPTAGPANQLLCGMRAGMAKHSLHVLVYDRVYHTYYLVLRYMGIEYTTQYKLLYMALCTEPEDQRPNG